MKYTKKRAWETIDAYKNMTCFYDNDSEYSISQNDMYNMLKYRMKFGEAETRVIIAALVISGAKFKEV